MDILEIMVTNVLIMPPHLVHLALLPVTASPLAGVRHNFDTSAYCGDCNSISEALEKLRSIRAEAASSPQDGS